MRAILWFAPFAFSFRGPAANRQSDRVILVGGVGEGAAH